MATHPDFPGATSRVARGKTYWRYRTPGGHKQITLPGQPGDDEFAEAYAMVTRKRTAAEILNLPGRAIARTFGKAARLFETSPRWCEYDQPTQGQYARHLEKFMNAIVTPDADLTWRDAPVQGASPSMLRDYIMSIYQYTPHAGRERLRAIKALIEVAISEEWITPEEDPTLAIRLKKPKHVPQAKWPQGIMDKFEARHPIGSSAHTCYSLAKWLGNRRGDVAELEWDQLVEIETEDEDGDLITAWVFDFRQGKNRNKSGGQHVVLGVPDKLMAVLNALGRKPGKTILQREDGEPYSIKSLTGTMAKWCQQADIPAGYTMHGLRRTFAHELAKSKVDLLAIRDMMGHANVATTQIYLNEADLTESAIAARNAVNVREAKKDKAKRQSALRIVS